MARHTKLRVLLAAACFSIGAGATAHAGQIVQTIPLVQQGTDVGSVNINGADFNTQLGALTSITATVTGTFQANIYSPNSATLTSPVASTLMYSFNFLAPGDNLSGSVGSLPLTVSGTSLVSTPDPVSLSLTIPNIGAFEYNAPYSTVLGVFDFYAKVGAPVGAAADSSTFNGNLVLTYNYAIPEPSTALAMASAMLLLAGMSRRRGQKAMRGA